jgi:hypothetical protein
MTRRYVILILHKILLGRQMKDDGMGKTYNVNGGENKFMKTLVECQLKRYFGRQR